MIRLLLSLFVIAIVSDDVHALTIDLSNALYSTSAYAEVDADSDGINANSAPPTALPLFSHAAVSGADASVDEFAYADAVADNAFLSVSSEAQGSLHHAGAVAEASLELEFTGAGRYVLSLDFESLLDMSGGETGAALGVVVSAGARTLFDETFTESSAFTRSFELASGEQALLHVGLISTADAFGEGGDGVLYGFNLASVAVELQAVPNPAPLALLATCLPLLLGRRARRR